MSCSVHDFHRTTCTFCSTCLPSYHKKWCSSVYWCGWSTACWHRWEFFDPRPIILKAKYFIWIVTVVLITVPFSTNCCQYIVDNSKWAATIWTIWQLSLNFDACVIAVSVMITISTEVHLVHSLSVTALLTLIIFCGAGFPSLHLNFTSADFCDSPFASSCIWSILLSSSFNACSLSFSLSLLCSSSLISC